MALSDAACRNAKPREKAYKIADGGGLYLFISPSGGKLWRQDYAHEGKRRTASFGKYPAVGLARARDERDKIKAALAEGLDPNAKAPSGPTFEEVARAWYAANLPKWKTSYSARFWRQIESDILTGIGSTPIVDIEAPKVLELLRAIESRDAIYTARRIHQMVSTIFRFAIAGGLTKFNPAADLHVALKPVPKEKHRAALKEGELPDFFRRLAKYDGERQTALALKAVAHTFVRTNEIRFAKWSEFDGNTWRIPADRMKMGREHLVPLSRQARAIFDELRELADGSEWVLPGAYRVKPISENTLLYAVYRMGLHSRASVHGLRATASTILNESEQPIWDRDGIEHQLAHAPDDAIRAAYNRGERWQMRVRMMQWYSDLLDKHEKAGIANDLAGLLD